MASYVANESYKHKYAKKVFKKWCQEKEFFNTNFFDYFGYDTYEKISWTSNREKHAWLEYPIVVNEKYDSVTCNWDEIWGDCPSSFVPTFDDCKKRKMYPAAIVDVVLTSKGMPTYFIEICHKNPVSKSKLEKLESLGVPNLIEIDADWILNQTKRPEILKIKRWLI
jgi:hypothetical protein